MEKEVMEVVTTVAPWFEWYFTLEWLNDLGKFWADMCDKIDGSWVQNSDGTWECKVDYMEKMK